MTYDEALFVRDGELLVPTALARGPWSPKTLHGGAVAALLAGEFAMPGMRVARLTIDLLAPVGSGPLRVAAAAPEVGRRVARQRIGLWSGEREVAVARALAIRTTDQPMPAPRCPHPDPFAGADVPDLDSSLPAVRQQIGWDCFDTGGVATRTQQLDLPGHLSAVLIKLLVPVVEGETVAPLSRAAAAADYGSMNLGYRLNFDDWSFMSTDLTVNLARLPGVSWVGLLSSSLAEGNGGGVGAAQLFDENGPIGQASQSLFVEARERRSGPDVGQAAAT